MSTLLAKAKLKEGYEDFFEEIAQTVFKSTHENESGVVRYEYFRGTDERTYYVLLSFNDFDSFMRHQVADYHHNVDFMDCFEDFRLEWLDPISGASPLAPSQTTGNIDEDRGELWNEYVNKHSEEAPTWWTLRRDS
jgi:quinol monooxygenase YgiN